VFVDVAMWKFSFQEEHKSMPKLHVLIKCGYSPSISGGF